MPTLQVNLTNVKQRKGTNNVLFTATANNGQQIVREIDISQMNTWDDFAQWLLDQESEFVLLPEKEKSLSIDFHTENVQDEFGNNHTIRVLDSVEVL